MSSTTATRPGQSMPTHFNFNDISLSAIEHEEDLWLTGEDIGRALEYAQPRDAIKKLYQRNQAELDGHSVVIKVPVSYQDAGSPDASEDAKTGTCGVNLTPHVGVAVPEGPSLGSGAIRLQPVRVFNEEGVMILTMLSSQPKAAAFRSWAVQVLKAFRHGNLTLSNPANRQRLLEICIKEARYGNPVAVHTLISTFGYPETLRQEVKNSLLPRHVPAVPEPEMELVEWFVDAFLPRLRDEIEGQAGDILKAIRSCPSHMRGWREVEGEGRWCLKHRTNDLFTFICDFAKIDGVNVGITSQTFAHRLNNQSARLNAAGWKRIEHSQVHGWKHFYLILTEGA